MSKSRRRTNSRSALSRRSAQQRATKGVPASQLPDDLREKINLGVRKVAAELMNRLAERGPAYSGTFRDSWVAIPIGTGASGSSGGAYPYQLSDIPVLSLTIKEVRRVKVFEIVNTTEYAEVALDLAPGTYVYPGYEPEGGIEFGVAEGRRYGKMRGEVKPYTSEQIQERADAEDNGRPNRAPNFSTAEEDWYTNYMRGGEVDDEIRRAFKFAFE